MSRFRKLESAWRTTEHTNATYSRFPSPTSTISSCALFSYCTALFLVLLLRCFHQHQFCVTNLFGGLCTARVKLVKGRHHLPLSSIEKAQLLGSHIMFMRFPPCATGTRGSACTGIFQWSPCTASVCLQHIMFACAVTTIYADVA